MNVVYGREIKSINIPKNGGEIYWDSYLGVSELLLVAHVYSVLKSSGFEMIEGPEVIRNPYSIRTKIIPNQKANIPKLEIMANILDLIMLSDFDMKYRQETENLFPIDLEWEYLQMRADLFCESINGEELGN
ncbi:MAG TPA: hypothetical protein VJ438_03075 [Candidatus Nanoarchaeia archaeon]|nr:hypothetical protein [Candidatus Nanoarchaeia archaeon]